MALGLGAIGLTPADFWSATPRELDAMLRGRFGNPHVAATALSPGDLLGLMAEFPD